MRHEGFLFFGPRKSGEGSSTDRIIFAGLISPFYLGSEWGIDIKLYSNHAKNMKNLLLGYYMGKLTCAD